MSSLLYSLPVAASGSVAMTASPGSINLSLSLVGPTSGGPMTGSGVITLSQSNSPFSVTPVPWTTIPVVAGAFLNGSTEFNIGLGSSQSAFYQFLSWAPSAASTGSISVSGSQP